MIIPSVRQSAYINYRDSQQMEGFFMCIAQDPDMPGYEVFEKEAWAFKVGRALAVSYMFCGS